MGPPDERPGWMPLEPGFKSEALSAQRLRHAKRGLDGTFVEAVSQPRPSEPGRALAVRAQDRLPRPKRVAREQRGTMRLLVDDVAWVDF